MKKKQVVKAWNMFGLVRCQFVSPDTTNHTNTYFPILLFYLELNLFRNDVTKDLFNIEYAWVSQTNTYVYLKLNFLFTVLVTEDLFNLEYVTTPSWPWHAHQTMSSRFTRDGKHCRRYKRVSVTNLNGFQA